MCLCVCVSVCLCVCVCALLLTHRLFCPLVQARSMPPTTLKEVLESYDPNKKLEAARRLQEEVRPTCCRQHSRTRAVCACSFHTPLLSPYCVLVLFLGLPHTLQLDAHAEAQQQAQLNKYSKKAPWKGRVGEPSAKPWDPRGTFKQGLSIAAQRVRTVLFAAHVPPTHC